MAQGAEAYAAPIVEPSDPALERHTIGQTTILHLVPGILITLVFATLAPLMERFQLPTFLALCVAGPAVLLPGGLGYLYLQGYCRNGRLSLDGVVLYRSPLPWWQYVALVPLVVVASGGLITLLAPLSDALYQSWFAPWLPKRYLLTPDLNAYDRPTLMLSYAILFVTISVIVPIIEEIWFRGYLLPRMAHLGLWGVVLASVLFALYHFWTPWLAVGRAVGLIPLILVAQWRRNIFIGMAAHIVANSVDVVAGVIFILRQP
jgi:hypothetical protein